MHNTAIEEALNHKMWLCYLSSFIVLAQNKGSACVLAELDSSILNQPIVAFYVIPYFAWKSIPLPPLTNLINDSLKCFKALQDSEDKDLDASDISVNETDSDSDELHL